MATIRPFALPPATTVNPSSAIINDDGAAVTKATPLQIVDAARPKASQVEAQTGTDNEKIMTPLRVSQAISEIGVTPADLASTDTGKGAALVAYKADVTGAPTRDMLSKARDILSVTDYGAVADGVTDNTAAILDFWTALGSTWAGTVHIPYNVKFDFSTVADAAPVRANVVDDSGINGWDTSGFRQKIVGDWERGDPTSVADLNRVVSSGHHSVFVLENRGSAGSTSGDARIASLMWSGGRFKEGQPGIRSLARITFSGDDASGWAMNLRKMATFAAKDYEIWRAGQVFGAGSYTITGGRTYFTSAGGTAGATQPTHTTGTVSDGGIDWTYIETAQDATIFTVDEYGRAAWNSATATGTGFKWKQSVNDPGNKTIVFEATGPSSSPSLFLSPTNSSGNVVPVPWWQANTAGELRLIYSGGIRLLDASTSMLTIGAYGHREVTATDGDTTPSVANCSAMSIGNTSATTITGFDDGQSRQEITLLFTTANTTLQHSATLILSGGVDANPPADGVMVFKRFAGRTAWNEVSRNF